MPLHHPCMSVLANSGYPDLPMQLRLLFVPVVASEPGLLTPSNHGGRTVRRFAPFAAPYELLRGDHSTSFAGVKLLVLPTLYSASAALSLSQSPCRVCSLCIPNGSPWHTVQSWAAIALTPMPGMPTPSALWINSHSCFRPVMAALQWWPPTSHCTRTNSSARRSFRLQPLVRPCLRDDLASSGILPAWEARSPSGEQCSGLRALSIHDSLEAACTELIALRLAAIGRDDSRLATHVGDDRAHLVAESSVGALDLVYLPPVSNPPLSDWDARVSAWVDMARRCCQITGLERFAPNNCHPWPC